MYDFRSISTSEETLSRPDCPPSAIQAVILSARRIPALEFRPGRLTHRLPAAPRVSPCVTIEFIVPIVRCSQATHKLHFQPAHTRIKSATGLRGDLAPALRSHSQPLHVASHNLPVMLTRPITRPLADPTSLRHLRRQSGIGPAQDRACPLFAYRIWLVAPACSFRSHFSISVVPTPRWWAKRHHLDFYSRPRIVSGWSSSSARPNQAPRCPFRDRIPEHDNSLEPLFNQPLRAARNTSALHRDQGVRRCLVA